MSLGEVSQACGAACDDTMTSFLRAKELVNGDFTSNQSSKVKTSGQSFFQTAFSVPQRAKAIRRREVDMCAKRKHEDCSDSPRACIHTASDHAVNSAGSSPFRDIGMRVC